MPYQSTSGDRRRAYVVGAVYLILASFLSVMLFLIWPPIPWPWPAETDKEKARLAAILKDSGCPEPTSSQSPATAANTNQAPTSSSAGNTNQTGPQPQTTTGTQPATPAGGQANPQTTGQPGTAQQPAAGTTQPAAQPANTTGSTTTTSGATTTQANQQAPEIVTIPMNLIFKKCVPTTLDERLLLLVIVVGMLGAFVHGATSLADYLGNNAFNKSWTWFYLLRPPIGMALALVFYFAIRGGFLSTTGGAKDINPYGIAALAGMVGMFSKQATDKLGEIFSTLFRSGGDDRRDDPLKGTGPAFKLDPPTAVAGGEAFTLTVTGSGFVDGATINVNDNPLPTTFESETKLSAQVSKDIIANAGTLKVTVVKDQTKTGPVDFVVSAPGAAAVSTGQPGSGVSANAASVEQPVSGEGGDEDLIDGCDVEMKADTPDEDLPITKGGVK